MLGPFILSSISVLLWTHSLSVAKKMTGIGFGIIISIFVILYFLTYFNVEFKIQELESILSDIVSSFSPHETIHNQKNEFLRDIVNMTNKVN